MTAYCAGQAPPGPFRERRAFNEARREQARERDAARYKLVEERRATALRIPDEQGFLVAPPGRIEETQAVLSAANELLDSIGHDALVDRARKGGFLALGLIPESGFELDSPYMRFALSEEVVGAVAAYLGLVPVLGEIDVWYSVFNRKKPKKSQLWHLDHADTTQVKVFVHLSDVTPQSGPLTALDASTSDKLAERLDYVFGDGKRPPDKEVATIAGSGAVVKFSGSPGTVDFVDTSRCFHFGSRVEADGTPRRLFVAQYLTPYAFDLGEDLEEAPFRGLAADASSELQALVLGAA